ARPLSKSCKVAKCYHLHQSRPSSQEGHYDFDKQRQARTRGRKCGAIRRRRTGAKTESVFCNCGSNCRMQCALMHWKTESGLQEVRSTDEL
ncbi:hypothetical protein M514_23141, partial [Trichuris suis]